jgi:hypothetical protein
VARYYPLKLREENKKAAKEQIKRMEQMRRKY